MIKSRKYSIADARANLPAIVDQAESGVEVELTRRGTPVAAVVSLRTLERLKGMRPRFADVYKGFLTSHSLKEIGLDSDFFKSARVDSSGRKVSL